MGNSLAIQWLGLQAFIAEGPGSIPGWGAKIPPATWHAPPPQRKKSGCTDLNQAPCLFARTWGSQLWNHLNPILRVRKDKGKIPKPGFKWKY